MRKASATRAVFVAAFAEPSQTSVKIDDETTHPSVPNARIIGNCRSGSATFAIAMPLLSAGVGMYAIDATSCPNWFTAGANSRDSANSTAV